MTSDRAHSHKTHILLHTRHTHTYTHGSAYGGEIALVLQHIDDPNEHSSQRNKRLYVAKDV